MLNPYNPLRVIEPLDQNSTDIRKYLTQNSLHLEAMKNFIPTNIDDNFFNYTRESFEFFKKLESIHLKPKQPNREVTNKKKSIIGIFIEKALSQINIKDFFSTYKKHFAGSEPSISLNLNLLERIEFLNELTKKGLKTENLFLLIADETSAPKMLDFLANKFAEIQKLPFDINEIAKLIATAKNREDIDERFDYLNKNLEKIKLALRFPKDDNPILNIIANSTSPLFANIDCIEKIQEKLQDSESESIPTLKFSVIAFGILSSREFDNVDILTQKIDLIIKHKEAIKIICKHSQGPNLSVLDVANFIYGFDSEEVDKTLSDFYQAFENKTFFRNKACLVFNNKRLKLSAQDVKNLLDARIDQSISNAETIFKDFGGDFLTNPTLQSHQEVILPISRDSLQKKALANQEIIEYTEERPTKSPKKTHSLATEQMIESQNQHGL